MKQEDKNTLLTIGGLALLWWLLSRKKKGKCPRCNYPVTSANKTCPNCGQELDWRSFQ